MPNRRPDDHLFNGRFRIELEGVNAAHFMQCSGLEARVDVVEFASGDELRRRKRPGRPAVANLVLRRGVTAGTALWDWFKQTYDGTVTRRSGSIIVNDDTGQEIYRYNFYEGWPCRWKSLELAADEPGSLIEELEIAFEHFERA
jgi:phage tail-like protein